MEESRPGANDTERWVGFQVWKAEKGELRGASSTSEHPKTEKAFNLNPAPAQSSAQIRSSPENFLKSFPIAYTTSLLEIPGLFYRPFIMITRTTII